MTDKERIAELESKLADARVALEPFAQIWRNSTETIPPSSFYKLAEWYERAAKAYDAIDAAKCREQAHQVSHPEGK